MYFWSLVLGWFPSPQNVSVPDLAALGARLWGVISAVIYSRGESCSLYDLGKLALQQPLWVRRGGAQVSSQESSHCQGQQGLGECTHSSQLGEEAMAAMFPPILKDRSEIYTT